MRKRLLLALIFIFIVTGIAVVWQAPTIVRAIPSRYVARLPEPIQTIGAPENVELLPTASAPQGVENLLAEALATATSTVAAVPASPTPPPTIAGPGTASASGSAPATETATSTATPEPTATATTVPLPAAIELTGMEHRIQVWNNCGPATLSMALSYYEIQHSQEQIADAVKPDPEDRNVTPEEMARYVRDNTNLQALSRTNGSLQTLRHLLSEQIPVIIEYGLWPENEYRWMDWMGHYLLVVAYDDDEEAVWVYDSWPRTGEIPDEDFVFEPVKIGYDELDRNWRAFNRTYIVLYPAQSESIVTQVVGEAMDDTVMWENSLAMVRRELEAEPEDPFLWFNFGTILNARGDYEQASTAFDQARTIGLPGRMMWYQFGPYEAYYQTGRYEDVIVLADVTLKDRPYFEEAYYYKALAQIELGETDEARQNLRRAINFNPNFEPAHAALEALELASN